MYRRLFASALLGCSIFAVSAIAESVVNPVKNFLMAEEVGPDGLIYQIRVDINNDGIEDYILSSSSEYRDGQRAGMKWDFYVSAEGGFYQVTSRNREGVYFRQDAYAIERMPESGKVGVKAFLPADANHGTFVTYFVENDQIVQETKYVQTKNPDGSLNKGLFAEGHENRLDIDIVTETAGVLADKLGVELDVISEKNDDTYYVVDQENPQRQLVYSSVTNELLGYEEYGIFHPISEEELEQKSE